VYAGIINDLQIIWFSNILTWSIPDEGYSRTLNLISKVVFFTLEVMYIVCICHVLYVYFLQLFVPMGSVLMEVCALQVQLMELLASEFCNDLI
jgi:hypothetical protein